jgi:hypothetical protein
VLAFDLQLSTLRPLFRVWVGGDSGELIERHVAAGWRSGFEQGFDAAHGFGWEQEVAATVANLCGNVVDHHHLTPVFDGVEDLKSRGSGLGTVRTSPKSWFPCDKQ